METRVTFFCERNLLKFRRRSAGFRDAGSVRGVSMVSEVPGGHPGFDRAHRKNIY
jgi:hypothetical protein